MACGGSVMLLHGLGRAASLMEPLARALRRDGFDVFNLDYPARRFGIAALADQVEAASARWRAGHTGTLHLVGHSLGGLVARAWIARHRPDRLGRVVLLGPPSGGSELADLLANQELFQRIFGPAGRSSQPIVTHATRSSANSTTRLKSSPARGRSILWAGCCCPSPTTARSRSRARGCRKRPT